MEGKMTQHNLYDLINFTNRAKATEQQYRADRVKVAERERSFLLFIDFRKAFDVVNRQMLLEKMSKQGLSQQMVEAFR